MRVEIACVTSFRSKLAEIGIRRIHGFPGKWVIWDSPSSSNIDEVPTGRPRGSMRGGGSSSGRYSDWYELTGGSDFACVCYDSGQDWGDVVGRADCDLWHCESRSGYIGPGVQ